MTSPSLKWHSPRLKLLWFPLSYTGENRHRALHITPGILNCNCYIGADPVNQKDGGGGLEIMLMSNSHVRVGCGKWTKLAHSGVVPWEPTTVWDQESPLRMGSSEPITAWGQASPLRRGAKGAHYGMGPRELTTAWGQASSQQHGAKRTHRNTR